MCTTIDKVDEYFQNYYLTNLWFLLFVVYLYLSKNQYLFYKPNQVFMYVELSHTLITSKCIRSKYKQFYTDSTL